MDDDYVLISKSELKNLRVENKTLNDENSSLKSNLDSSKNNLENEDVILKHLKEIKDLNKQTLNSILSKEEDLSLKIDSLTSSFRDLIHSISDFTTENQNENSKQLEKFLERVDISENETRKLDDKLELILDFVNKLKVMLSQIKKIE